MQDDPLDLSPELLDDFFAECDELLGIIRAQLALLDNAVETQAANPAAIETLYRTLHSIKGNAAIVGLAVAEQLAHSAEGVLRDLSRGEAPLDSNTLELLGRVEGRLGDMIAKFRLQQSTAPADDLVSDLGRLRRNPPASTLPSAPTNAPVAINGQCWRVEFSPSAELDARGVNVTSVRVRLAQAGTILSAVPIIAPGGRVKFEFVVDLPSSVDLPAWKADGLDFRPVETASHAMPAPRAARAAAAPAGLFTAPSHIVRIDLTRLDELMRITGDMVIHRFRLQDRIAEMPGDTTGLQEVNLAFTRLLRDLRSAVVRARLVPMKEIFSRIPLVVRDLGRETGKKVRLVIEGAETEVDKYVVERLKEPLLHLVRNAVSHGLELPDARLAAGKTAEGTLRLRAAAKGDSVLIQVRDDGGGIRSAAIIERARALGLPVPDPIDETTLLGLLCHPGFSTRDHADRTSGRGMGMAVVATTMRELGGTLSLSSAEGGFAEFTLRLPLTLSIADTFIVRSGPHLCAVMRDVVSEIVQFPAEEVRLVNRRLTVPHRDRLIPLLNLRSLFGLAPEERTTETALILTTEPEPCALIVDRIQGHREVVVRPIQDALLQVPGVTGATDLGDGKPTLLLDAVTVAQQLNARRANPSSTPALQFTP